MSATADAQTRRPPAPARPAGPAVTLRGFADIGMESFEATRSFEAVFGSARGMLFGGGLDIVERHGVFGGVRASRFRSTGERVFVFDDEVFPLGIANTVAITPLEFTGGYRFTRRGAPIVPYLGGGVGVHRYSETSTFADGDEENTTFVGYHLLGGAEIPIWKWIATAVEVQWTAVPDALGQDANGVSAAFGETDLGGATVRVKVVVGR